MAVKFIALEVVPCSFPVVTENYNGWLSLVTVELQQIWMIQASWESRYVY